MLLIALCSILCVTKFALVSANSGCSINIDTELAKNEPIFFNASSNNAFLIPVNGTLKFRANEEAVISCSNSGKQSNKNYIVLNSTVSNLESSKITCVSGNKFKSDLNSQRNFKSIELSCQNKNTGSVERTQIPCAESGKIINIGFQNKVRKIVPLIKICYDFATESAIYSQHVVYGRTIKNTASHEGHSFRKTFEQSLSDKTYTRIGEEERLTELLGAAIAANYVDKNASSQKYLARGHLTPNADGIFSSWQQATYFYVNVVPQWQIVNNGNWKRIESLVRTFADKKQENLQVFTGSYGTLSLRNNKNNMVNLTLAANKVIVPKWLWKIVKSTESDAAIAFITLNNVNRSVEPFLCKDICLESNWAQTQFTNDRLGYTYCCNVNELTELEHILPNTAFSTSVLNYENSSPNKRRKTNP